MRSSGVGLRRGSEEASGWGGGRRGGGWWGERGVRGGEGRETSVWVGVAGGGWVCVWGGGGGGGGAGVGGDPSRSV